MSRRRRGHGHGERQRFLESDRGLVRIREDLKAYGIHFSWERDNHFRSASGLYQPRLIGTLRGQVDNAARSLKDEDGRMPLAAAQHSGYQAAAFAMTLVSPHYPNALIEGGKVLPTGEWRCMVWLDPTDAQLLEREAAVAREEGLEAPRAQNREPIADIRSKD